MKECSLLIPLLLGPCLQARMLGSRVPEWPWVRTFCPSGCFGTNFYPKWVLPLSFLLANFSSTNISPYWRLVGSDAFYGRPCT